MVRSRLLRVGLVILVCLACLPAAALAQTAIAGVVKDTTGAVLPGVTVEASSPALIERARTVITDGGGQYKVVDLRPGLYAVTFTLAGFNTVKREGIELTTDFTATVNAEMRVGALEETVTVSGASPVVDVQNSVQRKVVTSEIIDVLPTARSNQDAAMLFPGLVLTPSSGRPTTQDVGGLAGERQSIAIHGGRPADFTLYMDGMPYNVHNGIGISGFTLNAGEAQEYTYELGAVSVETPTGGIRSNVISKQGGNLFKGTFFGDFSNGSLVSDNLTDDLRARGLPTANSMKRIWDVNPSVGGPFKRDRLWFFGSFRHWGLQEWVAGMYYPMDPSAPVYTPDLSRRAIDDNWNTAEGFRLTYQATPRNKFNLYVGDEHRCQCNWGVSATRTPEAAGIQKNPTIKLGQVTWSSPLTNRLLLEAGYLGIRFDFCRCAHDGVAAEQLAGIQELRTGLLYRSSPSYNWTRQYNNNERFALSYVTGSHAFKAGFQLQHGFRLNKIYVSQDVNLNLLDGVPRQIVVYATPYTAQENLNAALGLFAQDQWTVKRLTLNLGVRFDHHNSSVPAQSEGVTRFVPAHDFAAVSNIPNWNDVAPRLGASYDLFGNGKTALKVTLSRYVIGETVAFAASNNPVNTSVNSTTRQWTDVNGDFIPQESELGPLTNNKFGTSNITTRYDTAATQGFGNRSYNWETTAGVQHEVLPRVAVNATYFRRWYGSFLATDNQAVTPADYDSYCITAPVNTGLPGGGGYQICGLYDVNPTKLGQVNNLVTFAKNFGTQSEVYNGADLTIEARLPHGALLSGGLNTGRSETNNCFVVDSPQQLRFCDIKPPFSKLTQIKFNGFVGLPWGFNASGTFQSMPGPEMTASYTVTNTDVRASLGRNLASGIATVPLISPGTLYGDRLYQLDTRLTKVVQVGRTRLKGILDLYNAFNASTVLTFNNTYGSAWQRPTYILPGRMIKLGAQVDF